EEDIKSAIQKYYGSTVITKVEYAEKTKMVSIIVNANTLDLKHFENHLKTYLPDEINNIKLKKTKKGKDILEFKLVNSQVLKKILCSNQPNSSLSSQPLPSATITN